MQKFYSAHDVKIAIEHLYNAKIDVEPHPTKPFSAIYYYNGVTTLYLDYFEEVWWGARVICRRLGIPTDNKKAPTEVGAKGD